MTVRVPSAVLVAIAFVLASGVISFGVAFGVNEWRQSGYIDCVAEAQEKLLGEYEKLRAGRPVGPESPGPSGSSAAYDAYQQQFRQYESEMDAYETRSDAINQQWIDETRACR